MEKQREGSYAEIPGTAIVQANSGEMLRIINSEKAQGILNNKGLEIGKTYKIDGPKNEPITIAGISDDMFGFSADNSEEEISKLRPNRASIWVYVGDKKTIGFYGYLKDFEKRIDDKEGFIMTFNNKKYFHRKIDNKISTEIDATAKDTMNLL